MIRQALWFPCHICSIICRYATYAILSNNKYGISIARPRHGRHICSWNIKSWDNFPAVWAIRINQNLMIDNYRQLHITSRILYPSFIIDNCNRCYRWRLLEFQSSWKFIILIYMNGIPRRKAHPWFRNTHKEWIRRWYQRQHLFRTRIRFYNWPLLSTTIFFEVLPLEDPYDSIFLMTSIPSMTDPKTTCFPSSLILQKKNLPFSLYSTDKELRSIGIRTCIGHWENTRTRFSQIKVTQCASK